MPRNRSHIKRGRRPQSYDIADWQESYLLHGEEIDTAPRFAYLKWRPVKRLGAWRRIRESVLETWTRERPGTRPFAWWKFDAPGPRERLGGIGTPSFQVLNEKPIYRYGIPARNRGAIFFCTLK